MDNVVEFKAPSVLIFECACGSTDFQLFSDHTIQCSQCHEEPVVMGMLQRVQYIEMRGDA